MKGLAPSFIPAHFRDPVGLAMRVLKSGGPEGRFALWSALLGLMASPIDLAMSSTERRLYQRQTEPRRPMVIICGPARSGTSVVAAALIHCLPVGYINNLMALFPRSPLVANRLFGASRANEEVRLKTYYGRTKGMAAQNDGLFLWDRWLGSDRTDTNPVLSAEGARAMRRFWAAAEEQIGYPIVVKNNSLIVCASAVAEHLPMARFFCLRREPIYLAQSLLLARTQIHGDSHVPYGLHGGPRDNDPIADVCQQVKFYEDAARAQAESLGEDRFSIVSYEAFCRNPAQLINDVAGRVLGIDSGGIRVDHGLSALSVQARRRVSESTFARLASELRRLGVPVCEEVGPSG